MPVPEGKAKPTPHQLHSKPPRDRNVIIRGVREKSSTSLSLISAEKISPSCLGHNVRMSHIVSHTSVFSFAAASLPPPTPLHAFRSPVKELKAKCEQQAQLDGGSMDMYFKLLQTVLSNGRGMDVVPIKKPLKVPM